MKQKDQDTQYMPEALKQAKLALKKDEVPIGAVIVGPDGVVIARAHNLVETKSSQLAHAEMLAIEKACKKLNNWRLQDCTLYVTLEPCAMCMNFILLSRVGTVIYALESKKFGFSLDKYNSFEIYKFPTTVRSGACEQESLELLQLFFKKKRNKESGWNKRT